MEDRSRAARYAAPWIDAGVELPRDVEIGLSVRLHAGTQLGAGVRLFDLVSIGRPPTLSPHSASHGGSVMITRIAGGATILSGAIVLAGAEIGERAIIGDQAHIRERTVIGARSVIGRGTAIDNDVVIGSDVRIQTNCYLAGGTRVGDHAFIGPGVTTTNDNTMARTDPSNLPPTTIGRAARIGAGSVICPGVRVGEEAFLAAGAVVTSDVEPRAVVMGVPARTVREVPAEDLIENWRKP